MITLELARDLKDAGLIWRGNTHDFFAIPDRSLDDRVFVLADMTAYLELLQGWPVVSFHGVAEWALDYIMTADVVWLPTEEQLRETLVAMLPPERDDVFRLELLPGSYRCTIAVEGRELNFESSTVAEAYGRALLHLLHQQNRTIRV
jgi:hypothetical protein